MTCWLFVSCLDFVGGASTSVDCLQIASALLQPASTSRGQFRNVLKIHLFTQDFEECTIRFETLNADEATLTYTLCFVRSKNN